MCCVCAPCVLRACSVRAPCVPLNVSHTFVVSATLEQKGAPQLEDGSPQTVGTASPAPEWTCSLIGQGALHCSQCLRTMDAHMNNELHGVFLDYRLFFHRQTWYEHFQIQHQLSCPSQPLSCHALCAHLASLCMLALFSEFFHGGIHPRMRTLVRETTSRDYRRRRKYCN